MNEIKAVWAQSLDNSSPDSMILDDSILFNNEEKKRDEVASYVNMTLSDHKANSFYKGSIKLTLCSGQFVIEIPSVEKDNLGRLSPIIFYGKYDKSFIQSNDFEFQFNKLIGMIGRTVDTVILKDSNDLIKEHIIGEIQKKSRKARVIGLTVGVAAILIVPLPVIGKVIIGAIAGICVKLLLDMKEEK